MDRLKELDEGLFSQVKGIDILDAIAPLNYREQKQIFFESNYSQNPDFAYAKHQINTFQRKRELFNFPVEELKDEDLITLYSDVIESYVDKLDQFQSIGSPDFLYDSLRYFGEPTDKDLRNAQFVLHLPEDDKNRQERIYDAKKIVSHMKSFAEKEGYEYQIKVDDSMIPNALVSGTVVKVNSSAMITKSEVHALAHHELGVHLLTTLNGRRQPLRILSLGSPVNTMTQEGLAILCEYLAGHMTLPRLKVLALRVLAVKSMIEEKDFKQTFLFLKEQHRTSDDMAFTITARVYRGGGFTKDYLYFQGLHKMLNAYETRDDFTNMLCGKVSIEHLDLVTRLVGKGYLEKPDLVSPAIKSPVKNDSISRFIAHAIK